MSGTLVPLNGTRVPLNGTKFLLLQIYGCEGPKVVVRLYSIFEICTYCLSILVRKIIVKKIREYFATIFLFVKKQSQRL